MKRPMSVHKETAWGQKLLPRPLSPRLRVSAPSRTPQIGGNTPKTQGIHSVVRNTLNEVVRNLDIAQDLRREGQMQHCQQSLLRTLRNTLFPSLPNDWVQKSGYERKTLVRTVAQKGEHKNDLIRTKVCL